MQSVDPVLQVQIRSPKAPAAHAHYPERRDSARIVDEQRGSETRCPAFLGGIVV
ncbi:MAG: hypothetical protein ABII74_06520 [Elusimicrobiota bacterium]